MTTNREHGWEQETALNLAIQWRGTDPMTSLDQVTQAVASAVGPGTQENLNEDEIAAVVIRLAEPLRRQGTLRDDVAIDRYPE